MCLKRLVTATLGSSGPFYMGKWAWHVSTIPIYRVHQLYDNTMCRALLYYCALLEVYTQLDLCVQVAIVYTKIVQFIATITKSILYIHYMVD